MAKPEWGTKRTCPQCSARYYDMKKKPPVCPSCGAVFDTENVTKVRKHKAAPEPKKVATPEDIEDLPIETDGEDDIIEDADELGEDDLDMEDVISLDSEEDEM